MRNKISVKAGKDGRDPFNQNFNLSDREKWSTSKGEPVFSKLFRLDRTDPLSFGPKFAEILVEWIAPGVFHKIPAFPIMSSTKILETFIRSFPYSFNRKYVHKLACTVVFVGPAHFVFNAYPGRNATCPLSSCSNKNDGHAVALTDFYRCL